MPPYGSIPLVLPWGKGVKRPLKKELACLQELGPAAASIGWPASVDCLYLSHCHSGLFPPASCSQLQTQSGLPSASRLPLILRTLRVAGATTVLWSDCPPIKINKLKYIYILKKNSVWSLGLQGPDDASILGILPQRILQPERLSWSAVLLPLLQAPESLIPEDKLTKWEDRQRLPSAPPPSGRWTTHFSCELYHRGLLQSYKAFFTSVFLKCYIPLPPFSWKGTLGELFFESSERSALDAKASSCFPLHTTARICLPLKPP